MRQLLFAVCVFLCLGVALSIRTKLIPRDIHYVAASYDENGWPTNFQYDADAVIQVAADERGYIYAIGRNRISVFKIQKNKTTKLIHTMEIEEDLYTVQTCKEFVTVVGEGGGGRVLVFRGYSEMAPGDLQLVHSISVGEDPHFHAMTDDCRRIIVGLEDDHEIGIVTFSDGMFGGPPMYKTLTFDAFEGERDRLASEWFIFESETFTSNFDIEDICLNDKETKAFVTLQSSNGMAVIDLTFGQEEIIKVQGLGLKDWSAGGGTKGFDGSKTPKEARLKFGPVFSTYMAEHISCQSIKKKDLVFLAGEGQAGLLVDPLKGFELEETFSPSIKDEDRLGDLRVLGPTPQTDPDDDDKLNTLVMIGSRSYSAFACGRSDISLVADTGSDLELRTKGLTLYNNEPNANETLLEDFDESSVHRGPEPEVIETKKVCRGRYILMVGYNEDPGILFLYTLDTKNIRAGFVFQQMLNGYQRTDSVLTEEELYNNRLLSLRGTNGMTFVTDPRTKRVFLATASSETSSVELFELRIKCKARSPRRRRH